MNFHELIFLQELQEFIEFFQYEFSWIVYFLQELQEFIELLIQYEFSWIVYFLQELQEFIE